MSKKQSILIQSETPAFRRLNRRDFLKIGLMGSAAALMFPKSLLAECELTTSDVLGPFYSKNPPVRTVLAAPEEPGQRMFISGKVFADDCETPLGGAIVDIWHANDEGCYSVFEQCTPGDDPFNLRGQMLTNENGEYAFESIRPGYYGARPQHFHYRVVSPDGGTILTTQVYFEGDPVIPNDPFASSPDAAARIIPVNTQGNNEYGTFDVNLDAAVITGMDDHHGSEPELFALHQNYPNPFNGETIIRYSLPQTFRVKLSIYDTAGREVNRLVDRSESAGFHQINWSGQNINGREVASGLYLYRLQAESSAGRFNKVRQMLFMK